MSDKETAPWNLRHEANELLRDLDREIFRGQLDVWKLPLAVGMLEDFARRVVEECTAQAPTQEVVAAIHKAQGLADDLFDALTTGAIANFCGKVCGATPQGTPTECPQCGSKDFWTALPACHGGKAHKWHSAETTGTPNSSKNWQTP